MAVLNRLSEQEYRALALREPDRPWELWDGVPREKPPMSMMHDGVASLLVYVLWSQLDWKAYRVHFNARARVSAPHYYIPDVAVIPAAAVLPYRADPRALDAYADPLPLVVEVWSPSTGGYDVAPKLRGYQARGDLEIWYLHPFARTLAVWRRQDDGSYAETIYRSGIVPVASLPGVAIDLDALLDA